MALFRYLKHAFLERWNLLAFLGASGFALLSGRADVFLPVVLAAELAFVGLLASHPRYQKYVDAAPVRAARKAGATRSDDSLERMLEALPARSLQRFKALRTRCLELRRIALELQNPGSPESHSSLEAMQLEGLDRLLWVFLRLLYTQQSLGTFLATTTKDEVAKEIARVEQKLKARPPEAHDLHGLKLRKTMEDNLETLRTRLANVQKALENHEFVELEIDRLENKIRSLSELAINRQEPDFISSQVDQVAASIASTERTMSDLSFATGLEEAGDAVPELLRRKSLAVEDS